MKRIHVVLVILAICWATYVFFSLALPEPYSLPQVGMTREEVLHDLVGEGTDHELRHTRYDEERFVLYHLPWDRLGRRQFVFVKFDAEGKVKLWSVHFMRGDPWSEIWSHLTGR